MFAIRSTCSVLFALALSACGGSGGETQSANDVSGSSNDGSDWSGSGGESDEPSGPDCSDGTCFACGEGICPTGAYCDEGAESGPACAWLPECAGDASCGCITSQLSGCSCDDSSGGPLVSCN